MQSDNGGEIQISTEVQHLVDAEASSLAGLGAYVLVCVKDSGKGMSAEIARKIFDPYFTTKGEKGTGFGLAQVRAFMRQIGGHVSVRSEPGQGTTFDLLFPSQDGRPLVADDLWRQLDRWVNEGGAVGDGFLPRPQERTDGGRTERHRNSPARSAQSGENHNAD